LTYIGIWQPQTDLEVNEVRHTAGVYRVEGIVEVWSVEQLTALTKRLDADLIVLEQDTHAIPLGKLWHPANPFYLIGPMNGSIPREVRDLGRIVQVESPRRWPLRPSVAAAIVLHDQHVTSLERVSA